VKAKLHEFLIPILDEFGNLHSQDTEMDIGYPQRKSRQCGEEKRPLSVPGI